jgi:hypothetical protein
MSKKTLIGLSSYNASTKISNSNWENTLIEPVFINEGDTISLKASYLDTRNRITGNIIIEEDIEISLEYYFYYVNRGGTQTKSGLVDAEFPNKQQTCQEYLSIADNKFYFGGYSDDNWVPALSTPNAVSSTLPTTNDTTATGKIPQNLAPFVESIYHTISKNNLTNPDVINYYKGWSNFNTDTYFDSANFLHNPMGYNNTIDVNSPDGLPYVMYYSVPENPESFQNDNLNVNTNAMNANQRIPFTKKWGMRIKRGSYTPQYLSEIISRAMSIQKTKVNISTPKGTKTIDNKAFLTTPIENIASQFYQRQFNLNTVLMDGHTVGTGIYPVSIQLPFLTQGGFPYPNPPLLRNVGDNFPNDDTIYNNYDEPNLGKNTFTNTDYQNYQPNLFFNSKNRETMPDSFPIPLNPLYNAKDFNNIYKDDMPFLMRPQAFISKSSQEEPNGYTNLPNVHLQYNDANLNYFNGMPEFGNTDNQDITSRTIEIAYKPLCSDVISQYFNKYQLENGFNPTNDYGIRPIISCPVAGIRGTQGVGDEEVVSMLCPTAPNDITTPVVGATQMSLVFDNENNGVFSFPYLHTPIYTKPDATTANTQESVGMYPSQIYNMVSTPINNTKYILFETTVGDGNQHQTYPRYLQIPNNKYMSSSINPALFNYNVFSLTISKINTTYNIDNYEIFSPKTYISGNGGYFIFKGSYLGGIDGVNDLKIIISNISDFTVDINIQGVASQAKTWSVGSTLNGVSQIGAQSGIFFRSMTAKTLKGKQSNFWEDLGFDTKSLCHDFDKDNANSFNLTYEQFQSATTTAFNGTANIFNNELTSSGTSEISYASYIDSVGMAGWYLTPTFNSVSGNGKIIRTFDSNFVLQNKIIYFTVETTIPLNATAISSNSTDTGHALISIEGYQGNLLTDKSKLNVKTIISNFFISPNSFMTNSVPDSFIYEHIGNQIKLDNLKIMIIDPYTGKELSNIGNNSSVYLEITQALTKQAIASGLTQN